MAVVTPDTNRIDTFAAAHGISHRDVVRYNLDYFLENNTFWLPVGANFDTASRLTAAGRVLLVNDQQLIVNDNEILVVS